MAFFTETALLAAAAPEAVSPWAEDELSLLFLDAREPRTPPITAARITTMRTGTPILTQLLVRFFIGIGVI